jgi:hypothetical protein
MSETTAYTQNGATQRARELVEKYGQPRVFVLDPAALEPLLEELATTPVKTSIDGETITVTTASDATVSALVALASDYEASEKAMKAQRERITAALAQSADEVPDGMTGVSVLTAHGAPVFRVRKTEKTILDQAAVKKVFPQDDPDSAALYKTSVTTTREYVR